MNTDLLQRGKAIKLAVFDVDGVLTDGRLYFLEDGSEFKTCLLYTSPSPRDATLSRMPSSA